MSFPDEFDQVVADGLQTLYVESNARVRVQSTGAWLDGRVVVVGSFTVLLIPWTSPDEAEAERDRIEEARKVVALPRDLEVGRT